MQKRLSAFQSIGRPAVAHQLDLPFEAEFLRDVCVITCTYKAARSYVKAASMNQGFLTQAAAGRLCARRSLGYGRDGVLRTSHAQRCATARSKFMIGGGCHSHLVNVSSRRVALHVHLAYISIGFCLQRNQSEITTRLSQQFT